MSVHNRYKLILAVYLMKRDFAFVLFEGALNPIEWRIAGRAGDERRLEVIAMLLNRYEPDVLVLQDTSWTGTRRSQRITNLNTAIFELAEKSDISVCAFSRVQVRAAFSHLESPTRRAIAEAIAEHIAVFEGYLPPPRKPWASEHSRMGIFDAAALALTFFQSISGGEQAA